MLKKIWNWLIDKQSCGCNFWVMCNSCSDKMQEQEALYERLKNLKDYNSRDVK